MQKLAIKVENLSKRYRIGFEEQIQDTFVGAITSFIRSPIQKFRRLRQLSNFDNSEWEADDIIWALRDVSFEVKRGEVVGIIGCNGAGKSTLLKILSRITHPTSGRVELNGRVSSLLEVGTGFHPELTGRENIYLNGTILGMTRAEIDRKFDEIVDFSGVEKFIDTPVKRYSSGMRVRLAFSVAAFLEPEILLIDEVLSVGDASFQKKSIGKMQDVSKSGRTVFFVSHNLAAVSALCSQAFLLNDGRLAMHGDVDDVIVKYLAGNQETSKSSLQNRTDRDGSGRLRFSSVSIQDKYGNDLENVISGQSVFISLRYILSDINIVNAVIGINFLGLLGQQMFQCRSNLVGQVYMNLPQKGEIRCEIPILPLPPGNYSLLLWAKSGQEFLDVVEVDTLPVHPGDYFGTGELPHSSFRGLLVHHKWYPIINLPSDAQ